MTPALFVAIILSVAFVVLVICGIVANRAPYGRETKARGFEYTDKNGKPLSDGDNHVTPTGRRKNGL